jgi:uncharacterized membrane protein YeaQ/YmgE (transglycosylase-associated protein family)
MKALGAAVRELAGLFVDDRWLALETVAVVTLAGIVAKLIPDVPSAAGGVLLLGCLGALFANVVQEMTSHAPASADHVDPM